LAKLAAERKYRISKLFRFSTAIMVKGSTATAKFIFRGNIALRSYYLDDEDIRMLVGKHQRRSVQEQVDRS
jgi:hypothetical protein